MPRHSQSVDAKEARIISSKMHGEAFSTLPHTRSSETKSSVELHYHSQNYEPLPFEADVETGKSMYQPPPTGEFTTFGHKRSLSGESIGRNLHLAGAKLVLPSGEIPVLKPVDKNVIRPKLPPPGPPQATSPDSYSNNGKFDSRISQLLVIQSVYSQAETTITGKPIAGLDTM